jgi:hypothetical protein
MLFATYDMNHNCLARDLVEHLTFFPQGCLLNIWRTLKYVSEFKTF